jgi:glucose-6-phosphate 1-dehydrogenase
MTMNFSDETDSPTVEQRVLDFTRKTQYGLNSRGAYELLLAEAMVGDRTLFTRWDFVERSWKITDNLRKNMSEIHPYKAGSKGPFAALRLLKHSNHLQ